MFRDQAGEVRNQAVRDLQDVEREIADYCVRNRTAPTPAQIIAWEAAWAAYETADAAMVQEYQ